MVNFRIHREKLEKDIYFPFASFAEDSLGRRLYEEKCPIRTDFVRDRDRIIHSKAFRRLKHKTQVFVAPRGDHYRTRLTHTLEVSQIARTLARALCLNEDLCEAIALAHDLGHTPFGHKGEAVLAQILGEFKHADQSLKIVDLLEDKKKNYGLNLTYEVRDGIKMHTGKDQANTLEGKIIKFADRIAYINADIDDAIRADIISYDSLPKEIINTLGNTSTKRIQCLIFAIIKHSFSKPIVEMDEEIYQAMMELREFMFREVYFSDTVKSEDKKIENMLKSLFEYYEDNFYELPKHHLEIYPKDVKKSEIIGDFIAGMTDNFAINKYREIFMPKSFVSRGDICHL